MFQVNFSCVWSTFCCTLIIVISIVIIVVIIIIIIFICVWSTFWWGRRSRCPPRSGFPERQQCKPGWREPAEEKEIGSLIILIASPPAHTHSTKNKRLKHGKPQCIENKIFEGFVELTNQYSLLCIELWREGGLLKKSPCTLKSSIFFSGSVMLSFFSSRYPYRKRILTRS